MIIRQQFTVNVYEQSIFQRLSTTHLVHGLGTPSETASAQPIPHEHVLHPAQTLIRLAIARELQLR